MAMLKVGNYTNGQIWIMVIPLTLLALHCGRYLPRFKFRLCLAWHFVGKGFKLGEKQDWDRKGLSLGLLLEYLCLLVIGLGGVGVVLSCFSILFFLKMLKVMLVRHHQHAADCIPGLIAQRLAGVRYFHRVNMTVSRILMCLCDVMISTTNRGHIHLVRIKY